MTCSFCHSLLALPSLLVGNQRKHREQWRRKPWRRRDWAVAVLLEELELQLQSPHLLLQRGVLQDYLQDLLRELVLHVLHHVRSRHTRLQSGTFAFFLPMVRMPYILYLAHVQAWACIVNQDIKRQAHRCCTARNTTDASSARTLSITRAHERNES